MRAFMMMLLIITMISGAMAQAEKKIIINLASRALSLYDGNSRLGLYPLGVGKVNTPTPVGYYKILTKEIDPPWIDPSNPEYEIPSGENNPLGYRWMQIYGNYGIHGTNNPASIGYYVSNGCIRMREADVEELFDKVGVGTPVEITYNRVVVEKANDDRIVYYIYPDGYGRQAIDVKYVNSWIEPWGVSAFVENSEIAEAIERSDGEPMYIGKAYNIEINDKLVPATNQNKRHFDNKAVERGGIVYLPAVPIAIAMEMKLEWRHHTTLATRYGEVTGIEKKGQLYLNEDDAGILFQVEGWREGNTYKLKPLGPDEETFGNSDELETIDETKEILENGDVDSLSDNVDNNPQQMQPLNDEDESLRKPQRSSNDVKNSQNMRRSNKIDKNAQSANQSKDDEK